MAGTREGAIEREAKRQGIEPEDYIRNVSAGLKRCWRCLNWKPRGDFGADRSRYDGQNTSCLVCRRVKERKNMKGRPPTTKGRKHTPEARRKMSLVRKGNKNRLGKPFTPEQLAYLRRRTAETTPRGERHPNYKGGITPALKALRDTPEYKDWREAVFARDGYTCQACGDQRGGNLRAHHVLPFAKYPEHRFDVSNGLTLCEDCHVAMHRSA